MFSVTELFNLVQVKCDVTPEGSDVLSDPSGLSGHYLTLPQGVQQRGFPVVYMTHDGHHWGPTDQERRFCWRPVW